MTTPKLTVICHFYNEEFLLPFWLRHHRDLFDDGVLIDYDSTDRSVELIRELAPDWRIVRSRNREFGAAACDEEVMAIERELDGWKLVLNVTEFLFHPDPRGHLAAVEQSETPPPALGLRSLVMVDRPEDRLIPVDAGRALYEQRFHGFLDDARTHRRLRFLHREKDGAYELGRHGTKHRSVPSDELLILWYGWSPYDQIRARKLQIQTRIPESDRRQGWGWQHIVTPEELDARWASFAPLARDLREFPLFRDYQRQLATREERAA